ncbi:MAG: SDR family NAD(P)-dependent oxidoreductase [Candidatus Weimeria sp.]
MKKWAIITGASSGIGEEFAHEFYDMGYSLIIVSQTPEKLISLKNRLMRQKAAKRHPETAESDREIEAVAADLGDAAGMNDAAAKIEAVFKDHKNLPAILINSAGFGAVGEFSEISLEKQESMIDVNVKGLVCLTYRILPIMEKAGGGRILNVASSAGFFPGGPYMTIYYATKAFVLSFTNGLRQELKEKNSPVKISALCPGPVNTPFNERANVRNALPGISARRCVRSAISGMKRDKAVIVPGISIKAAELGAKILPAGAIIPIVSHQQKKKI